LELKVAKGYLEHSAAGTTALNHPGVGELRSSMLNSRSNSERQNGQVSSDKLFAVISETSIHFGKF
jgi:hypothetical protein